MSSEKKLLGISLIAAVVSSLCCITPVLALIAGTTGLASTFSWLEPFRPYLIAITILVLAVAWFQKLKPKKQETDCVCEDEKLKIINSKKLLILITLFAGIMLAFPYYTAVFYPTTKKEVGYVEASNINKVEYNIKGMTCTGCEVHIESEVNKLNGIIEVKADYQKGNTIVSFDKTKMTNKEVEEAVRKTGYKIIE